MTKNELQAALTLPQFPLSAKYDPEWLCENEMGPCSVWLTEFLMEEMALKPGMRVLDMGCGKGMSSIFLAKEYGVTVFANDLWISPSDNFKRFREAGLEDQIIPIGAEAHKLPYAEGFFDAIVSVDSYHYYGTDVLYLDYISGFLKPGGQIGIVVPGLTKEFDGGTAPAYMMPHWDWSMYAFHSPGWWELLWSQSQSIEVAKSDLLPDGFKLWLHWDKTLVTSGRAKRGGDVALLEADGGRHLTFARTVGRKTVKRWE